MSITWPTDLTKLMKRISTPAEEVFGGLDLLGDYVKELGDTRETAIKSYLRSAGILGYHGKIFHVDGGFGSDSADGLTYETPVLTFTKGLSLCTDSLHDVLLVRNYGTQDETYPIVMNKKRITVIGQPAGSNLPGIEPDTDVDGIEFEDNAGAGTRFFNFSFKGGATKAAVLMSGTIYAVQFFNCWFGMQGDGAKNAFRIESDSPDLHIIGCKFDESITQHHIHILGSSTRGRIENCRFHGIAETYSGITDTGGTGFLLQAILNNYFYSATAKKGFAIEHTGAGGIAFIDGNKANYAGQAPYIEDGNNFWCQNWKGNNLTLPSTS